MKILGIPSKHVLIIQQVPAPEPIAKLPPPVTRAETNPSALPPGVEIEKNSEVPSAKAVAADADAERKKRIKAERERLNHNALVWQRERAAHGSTTAMRSLGMRYLTGDGVEKDEARGMDLLRKAAEGGESAAKKELKKREGKKE